MKAWSWLLKKIDLISLLLGVCATLLFVPPWIILILLLYICIYLIPVITVHGYLPASFDVLHLPPSDLCCRRYYFYGLYSENPFLLNAHLAGKQLDNFAKPERTIIITIANNEIDTLFFSTPEKIEWSQKSFQPRLRAPMWNDYVLIR